MPISKPRPHVGWFRLPKSGRLFHGVIADGVAEIPEEDIDALESGVPVGSEVASAELVTDPDQIDAVGDESDDDVDRHEAT